MEGESFLPCKVRFGENIENSGCDFVCIVEKELPQNLNKIFDERKRFDEAFDNEISCFKSSEFPLPIVYSPVRKLSDYCDVRVYGEAAGKAIKRAIMAGSKRPLLIIPESKKFSNTEASTMYGALQELYVPIQLREDIPEKKQRIESLTIYASLENIAKCKTILQNALILEAGRFVARDIGGGDPERMSAPNVETYIKSVFPDLKITVVSDPVVFKREYPLFEAVNRAANSVSRHQGRIIFLEYKPPKPAKKSLLLVGKGVTYDTGGADIKAGGIMAGMSRDKCGAAAVAGFMKIIQGKKPDDVHVIGALCLVRNSVGEECYVADEIITSRAGVRVRVGNTDAEGRMCMADILCQMKELAINLPNPYIFTIATLTGHAFLAVGEGYSIVIDNSVAKAERHAELLKKNGDDIGDPFEISTLRQDDFDFIEGQVIGEDIVQCNNLPSSKTPRGHQFPAAFMIMTSGLDKYGVSSAKPIKYSHLDIAASAGEYPKMPTAAPILALVRTHLSI